MRRMNSSVQIHPRTTARVSGVAMMLFLLIMTVGTIATAILSSYRVSDDLLVGMVIVTTLIGLTFLFSLKVAQQWEKVIVLRLGRYRGLRGPGLFWIIPVVDSTPEWIDHRVMVTPFNAEKTLTKDTTQSIPILG